MKRLTCIVLLGLTTWLAGCGSAPPVPDWQLNARDSLARAQQAYLTGNQRVEAAEFNRALAELRSTGRADLLARAELMRCAARVASLPSAEEPLTQLVAAAVLLQAGRASPAVVAQAVDTASAQGWRRPLMAWLGVQARLAEQGGDAAEAARIRRRMALVPGTP